MSDKTLTLADVRRFITNEWPESHAEEWDRVGLSTGADGSPVKKIMLAVDAVRATVDEALNWGADLLLTHHPLLLRGIYTVAEETYKGSLLADLIRGNCALYSAHTNADVAVNGVSDALANALGLTEVQPLEPSTVLQGGGIGRVGVLGEAVSLKTLAERLTGVLPKTAVGARVAGDESRQVKKVALLGGSGDGYLGHKAVLQADVYITSDLRHHPAQEALEQYLVSGGPALIDIPHWASESLWLEDAAQTISKGLAGVEVKVSKLNTDPWSMRVG